MNIAEYGSKGLLISDVRLIGTAGRPLFLGTNVFVLTRSGEVTLATYAKRTSTSQPEFLTKKEGKVEAVSRVKHWCYAEGLKNEDGSYENGFFVNC